MVLVGGPALQQRAGASPCRHDEDRDRRVEEAAAMNLELRHGPEAVGGPGGDQIVGDEGSEGQWDGLRDTETVQDKVGPRAHRPVGPPVVFDARAPALRG